MSNRYLPLSEVKGRTSLSRATIYRLIAKGTFPRPDKLGERRVAWKESALETWINSRTGSQQAS